MQITSTEGNLALTQANWVDAIYWLYQEDDFTPTARYEKGLLHYTVADQVGTITELLTEDGYIDYRQKLNLWGEAEIDGHRHYAANDSNPLKCNHRFVGQYYDDESELHYNRFRYYSPETGQYISHDPIGLLGGFNPYGYVGIPTAFVDPLGLIGCPEPVAHNTTDLSKAVIDQRLSDGNLEASGTNYAAAKVRNSDGSTEVIVHRNDPRGLHSEQKIVAQAHENNQQIIELYSERRPCSGCQPLLDSVAPNAEITYSYPYSAQGKNQLQKFLDGFK